jgi:hypothetical protein
MFGPVTENGVCRRRTDEELMDLYRETDVISEIIKVRLRRCGLVEGMPGDRTAKNVFKIIPEGKRFRWKAKTEMDD